ncbi:TPA: hypothetical protein U1628_000212 [Streptococcus suis]|nr:hypothetical protein [Streptococcus suis]HEM5460998.1 hypothetical protein [Streptococcus suis]
MLVGVSQKRDFGWHIQVKKFTNLESAEFWLNKEQYDFRDRFIFGNEKEAIEHLEKLKGGKWAEEALKDASIYTLVDGELDAEFSPSYVAKQMGWDF